jgi:hypothetical protein
VALTKERIVRENKVLRWTCGPHGVEVTGSWEKTARIMWRFVICKLWRTLPYVIMVMKDGRGIWHAWKCSLGTLDKMKDNIKVLLVGGLNCLRNSDGLL